MLVDSPLDEFVLELLDSCTSGLRLGNAVSASSENRGLTYVS